MKCLLALCLALGLGACTVLDSNRAGSPFLAAGGAQKRTFYQGSYSLPRRYLTFKILANDRHFTSASHFSVVQEGTGASVLAPDPSALFRYDVNYTPSRFSRDQVDIEMENQMLSSITVATQDELDDVLVNFAQAAAEIARLSAGLATTPRGLGPPGGGQGGADKVDQVVAQLSFDPTDVASVKRAQHRLGRMMNLRIQPPPRPVAAYPSCDHSVCYRPLTTVVISFEEPHSGNSTDFVVQVPDPHQIAGVDLERSAFVDRETTLVFAGGTLQKIDMTKPSELAAAALLPVRIIEAIFTGTGNAISGLLGVRRNEVQGSVDLLNAQAAYLTALADYQATVTAVAARGVDAGALGLANAPATFVPPPAGQAADANATDAPATFNGTAAPGGAAAANATTTAPEQALKMTCTPLGGCVFEATQNDASH
ncbi:hypothetical protein [uncultured Tateyamaria sp.]|uniref:hypothetical protein n=1 Tax=uncultured Tateyamaria sp. TaxID=455651 RepID=UPI002623EDE6|nr:hypothetical protein [uncultured Tateyamaria sp.]